MDITLFPGKLRGSVAAIPSKSQAHRMLICAAFADAPTTILCPQTNRDMDATAACLNALGAGITRTAEGYQVVPATTIPKAAHLTCHDSGSTLRFLLPLAGALGVDATFHLEGRLAQRPLSPLWEEMERMGCRLSRPTESTIRCTGQLLPGEYTIDGSVSSQFITGLLLAVSRIPGESQIRLTGKVESRPYITMTQLAMATFGMETAELCVSGGKPFHSPGKVSVEGDWSNGAFWLAAQALGNDVQVTNLNPLSPQGDRAALSLLSGLKDNLTISAADIPDLVPILAVVAACNQGAVFTDIRRLRLKESDRVQSLLSLLEALGGHGEATEHTLTVFGTGLTGGAVDAANDHRIAMAAAIAATACTQNVTILGAECVNKSYPNFFEEYSRLGGNYEQHLR